MPALRRAHDLDEGQLALPRLPLQGRLLRLSGGGAEPRSNSPRRPATAPRRPSRKRLCVPRSQSRSDGYGPALGPLLEPCLNLAVRSLEPG
jgi:hypothetical protein